MAQLANVDITNTFNAWRIRVNDAIYRLNQTHDIVGGKHNILFANTITANSVLKASGNTALGAAGKLAIITGRLIANGSANVAFNLAVVGNTVLGTVGKRAIVNGRLSANGRLDVTNILSVSGNTVFGAASKRTIVNGNLQANGRADIVNAFGVTGNTVLGAAGKLTVVNARLVANGFANVVSRFSVVGNTILGGTSAGGIYSSRTIVNGLLTANGYVEMKAQTLTDAATIAWDARSGQVATVTLSTTRIMGAPTNLKVGTYVLHVIQPAGGSAALTWNGVFKWPGGTAPALTTTGNARDVFSFISDGTNLYGNLAVPNAS